MILTEGFDHPDCGVIMMARPTESKTVYVQCIGRGTRLKSPDYVEKFGVNECMILDFVDNAGKHNLINTATLDEGKAIEDKTFMTPERKAKLIAKREARIKLEEQKEAIRLQHERQKIELLRRKKLPVLDPGKFYDRPWFAEPATEKQIGWLKSAGVWQEGMEYTKGMATEHITNFEALPWQKERLYNMGYNTSGYVTQGQYYEVCNKKPHRDRVSG
jgi:type I site-specific restriction endonuclease